MRSKAAYIPATLFLLAAAALIASGRIPHRVAYDQLLYHGRAIDIFAKQWPKVDLTDYLSATTPLFHLTLAFLKHTLGLSIAGMQILCALITAALLILLGKTAASSLKPLHAAAIVLPFAASMYVFASGTWILPDNTAWFFVLSLLLLALHPRFTPRHLLLGGILLTVLTCTRQIHFWTSGLLIAAAWLSIPTHDTPSTPLPHTRTGFIGAVRSTLLDHLGRRCVLASLALLAILPAALMIIWFFGLWGGLVPPTFQLQYHMSNPAGPTFLLAVTGFVSCFFAGWTLPRVILSFTKHTPAMIAAAVLSLILAFAPVTTAGSSADYFAGRRTGLWDIAAKVPTLAHHTSLFIAALTLIGGLTVGAYIARWNARSAIIILCAFLGYGLAMAQGGELWQRYAEPFALMLLIVIMGLDAGFSRTPAPAPSSKPHRFLHAAAPLGALALTLLFVALNIRDLRKPGTQLVTDPAPPSVTPSAEFPNPRPDSPFDRYNMAHQIR